MSISESEILDSFRLEDLNPEIDANPDEGEMQDLGLTAGSGPSGSSGKPPLDPSSNKSARTSSKISVVWDHVTTFEGPPPDKPLMARRPTEKGAANDKDMEEVASVGAGREDNDNSAMDMFWKHEMESRKEENRTKLDVYLQEDREKKREDFDILTWWKINSPRFPILSCIARDVLVVPVSSVTSESASSTGGRILDVYRSCLAAKHVQALVCGQDWLRGSLDFNPAAEMEEQSEFDKLAEELKEVSIDPVINA
ncbi:hypothetical protein COLO4_04792 [Corchorus olitorius]|uniref:HAT C-terminal dimerisation domain-containing protein n=1 Tax=Corchorus olitorius TaxID=93759 RepID=A0A1R3KSX1_9ROSI|nr:hypothetical protein COLO4_04792 [Corchorus olitorius]